MNYIAILNNYWQLREQGILDRNAGDLYLYLVNKSNSLGWKNPFNHKNELICGFLGITEKTLIANRNKLKQDGLISFVSGRKGVNTEYFISPLGGSNYSETYSESYRENDSETYRETGRNTPDNNKHKLNKRLNKKRKKVRLKIDPAKKLEANGFSPGAEFFTMPLPEISIGIQVQRIRFTQRKDVTNEQVLGMWEVFKQTYFTGKKYYENEDAIYQHFGNWIKDQKFQNDPGDKKSSRTGSERSYGQSAGAIKLAHSLAADCGITGKRGTGDSSD